MLALLGNNLIDVFEEEAGKKKGLRTRKVIGFKTLTGGSVLLLKQVVYLLEFRLAERLAIDNFDELLYLMKFFSSSRHGYERGITSKNKGRSHNDIFSDRKVLSKP